jgi:hypothetical protein
MLAELFAPAREVSDFFSFRDNVTTAQDVRASVTNSRRFADHSTTHTESNKTSIDLHLTKESCA